MLALFTAILAGFFVFSKPDCRFSPPPCFHILFQTKQNYHLQYGKGILSPTHLGQIFDVNGTSAIRPPDDIDSYNNKFIYVIERCHMKDLSSNLKTLSLRDIVLIFYQIAYGLEYLHSLLIVHHDIKLENVLIDYNDNSPSHSVTSEKPYKSSLMYGIDLSNLYNLCSSLDTNNSDPDSIKCLRTWIQPFKPATPEFESPCPVLNNPTQLKPPLNMSTILFIY